MDFKDMKNATESAEFLGLKHRTEFFAIKEQHNLKPVGRAGNVWLYAISDLRALKRKMK